MPFMQRLTWDGIALHAGRVPGYPASHGCIRLPKAFAEELYAITSHTSTIVIVSDEPLSSSKGARALA
jgi:lipoprotein-anchoring transpeptidase ErfK/SrfK